MARARASGQHLLAVVALVGLWLPSLVSAATLVVDAAVPQAPATYRNLTAAVAAASNGDTVLVRPGVYTGTANSGVSFTDAKSLTIQGDGGWGDIVIDCGGANRALSYTGDDTSRVGENWLRNLTIRNCAAPNGGAIYADGLSVNVLDVSILDVSATGIQFGIDGQGGAIFARNTNSTFRNVLLQHVRHAFGGVFAGGTDSSRYTNVTFRDMVAVEFGGAFIPEQQSSSVLEDCLFEDNFAPFGASVDTGGSSTSVFRRVVFRNNKAGRGAGVYHYGDSKSKFYDCVFESNVGTNSGGAIECGTVTSPTFYNCTFRSNIATGQGGAMRTSGTSTPKFVDCVFFNNTAPRGGVASTGGLSSVSFHNCVMDSNQATLIGGALECQGEAAVTIDQSIFRHNKAFRGGGLYQDGPIPWVITNTVFEDNVATAGGGFACEGSSRVKLGNVTVRNNRATRDGGGAYVGFDAKVTVSSSHFEGNTCTSSGGGLTIADTAEVTVVDTIFKDNVAGIAGGGVAVSALANLTGCTFRGNTATADSGGGLYLAHTSTEQCEKTVLDGLTLTGNEAMRGGGGGIFYTWALLTTGFRRLETGLAAVTQPCIPACTDCSFSNNAAVYGASVATPTLALHVSAGTLLKHRALPLVPFNATVVTRDYFGNTVSQATGMRIVASLAPESSVACRLPAPPIVGVTQGVAAFTSIAVGASPATTCTLAFTAEPKEAGLPPDLNVDLELEACHVGYAAVGSDANYHCKVCESGTYNVNGDGICYSCGKGLVCPGGSTLLVSQGHWPFRGNNSGTVEAFQCPPHFCCPEASCPVASPCASYRDGFLCGSCFPGYAEVAGACVPCSGTNYSFIATVAVLALLFAILNVLLERNQSNPLLSQVTFFCQIAVLIIPASDMRATAGSFSSILDLDMAGLFETYDRLAGDSSSTCIAQWSGLSMTAAFFAVPCLLFASLGCVLLVHWVYHKALHRHHMAALATRAKAATRSHARSSTGAHSERLSVVLHDTVDTAVFGSRFPARLYTAAAFRLVLLSYSVVSDAALQLVSCHSPLGESVMVSQPSVQCWHGEHTLWGVASWLLVVFWVIGLPVGIVGFLWVVKQGGPLYSEHNKRQYGILYDTFRPKRYWFVAVGLARRSMAVVVHTLLFNSGLARQFGLFVLILVFLLVHVHMKPYARHYDNVVETGLLVTLILLSATMLARDALPTEAQDDSKYAFLIVTQVITAVLVGIWMVFAFGMMVVEYRRLKVKQVHTQLVLGTKLSPVRRLCACVLCIGKPPLHSYAGNQTPGVPPPPGDGTSTVNFAFKVARAGKAAPGTQRAGSPVDGGKGAASGTHQQGHTGGAPGARGPGRRKAAAPRHATPPVASSGAAAGSAAASGSHADNVNADKRARGATHGRDSKATATVDAAAAMEMVTWR